MRNLTAFIDMCSTFYAVYSSYPLDRKMLDTHEEIEELLEAYIVDCNAIEGNITFLQTCMENTQALVSKRGVYRT